MSLKGNKNNKRSRSEKKAYSSDSKKGGTVKSREKGKYIDFKEKKKKGDPLPSFREDAIRLNKFLSNAGICSRREADVLIQTGVVKINGEVITELGYKIKPTDKVQYDGETIKGQTKRYVLLNKPKGFTTNIDSNSKKTAFSLVKKACKEQLYPVVKMDIDMTGLLLFTNDGDMYKKLNHPKYKAKKIYHVELNKSFAREDLQKLKTGVSLDDGKTKCIAADFVNDGSEREIGIEIKSGKSQIISRMFEAIGYKVVKLDCVSFAGLTKKDMPRGYFRHLTEREVGFLKMTK
tara:strand:+ start:181 stop:1053 length:873 start_codon:yes stop_codon:yes gene_type:complete